jgi:hypothetical protein
VNCALSLVRPSTGGLGGLGLAGHEGNAGLAERFPAGGEPPPAQGRTTQEKGPAVSGGPLFAIKINRGTNERSFADLGDIVNISLDRLAFVQTYARYSASDGCAERSLAVSARTRERRTRPAAAVRKYIWAGLAWPRVLSWAAGGYAYCLPPPAFPSGYCGAQRKRSAEGTTDLHSNPDRVGTGGSDRDLALELGWVWEAQEPRSASARARWVPTIRWFRRPSHGAPAGVSGRLAVSLTRLQRSCGIPRVGQQTPPTMLKSHGPDRIPGRGHFPQARGCDANAGGELAQQMKAEKLRRLVTASDEAVTRYSRQIDAMATGISRLINRLETIELRLKRAGKRDPKE